MTDFYSNGTQNRKQVWDQFWIVFYVLAITFLRFYVISCLIDISIAYLIVLCIDNECL